MVVTPNTRHLLVPLPGGMGTDDDPEPKPKLRTAVGGVSLPLARTYYVPDKW